MCVRFCSGLIVKTRRRRAYAQGDSAGGYDEIL